MEDTKELITTDDIRSKVYIIRGQQVMLDKDLAEIYGYEVKRLNEQVKRNISRFPEDFMFQLNREEIPEGFSKSQFATLNEKSNRQGSNIKKMPFAFTEQGIYMLATVLRGELAEQQSIFIMRTFREMRHYIKQNQQFVTRSEMELLSSKVTEISVQTTGLIDKQKQTAMQIDGYSLEAQKTKMKAYCDYNEYEIAGEYEDAGKSGKSIEGRIAFNQMMDDIKSGKDRQGVLKVYLKESKKQKCKLIIS